MYSILLYLLYTRTLIKSFKLIIRIYSQKNIITCCFSLVTAQVTTNTIRILFERKIQFLSLQNG